MKTQVMIVVALLIPVALSSNSDMVVEAHQKNVLMRTSSMRQTVRPR
uniref:Uncharacterized protein n=1 Tax=Brassica oleracea TaxID=3712 RepID=A0A3P6FLE9_BRAOL|nr:unnamed protein product [Brassica oleracea]